jgi:gliding motility-associated-like protein
MILKFNLIWMLLIAGSTLGQSPNDCSNAILVCGSTSFGLEPDGEGFDEFSLPGNVRPPCYSFNLNTIWLRFVIEESGELTFDLIPDSGTADYDFAIYGPNVTCDNLGNAIRCSSTNPQNAGVSANTGLNLTETDFFEGPGEDGNGYLQYIDALAGEEYIILIDRPHGSGGFSMEMTGSAILPEQPTAHSVDDMVSCEMDQVVDESTAFNFDPLIPLIIQGQANMTVTFHESLNDANIGINPISSPYMNISNPMTIFYRIENNSSGCVDINDFEIRVEAPFGVTLPDDLFVCENTSDPVILATQSGFAYYEWSTGEEGTNLNSIEITAGGEYWVNVTDALGCKVRATTVVNSSQAAAINDITVEDFRGRENKVTVTVEGNGDYQYALDDLLPYQDENFFTDVDRGYHTVSVRDKKGCGITQAEVLVLDYPRFFTPNGDGINDYWQIEGIWEFPGSKILIFDRYGRILTGIELDSSGWNGTDNNGVPVPSNDYWFAITMEDGREIRGHFTLKR